MTRVVVGYCHYGIVQERFMQSLIDLLVYEAQRGKTVIQKASARGPYIADGRNVIVREFLKTEAEWLLFLDIDMTFTPDLIEVLLSAAGDRKIVAGFYLTQYHTEVKAGICSSWLVYGEDGKLATLGEIKKDAIAEVASVGMGGTLIHRSVFEAVSESRSALGADDWTWFGHDLIDGVRHGEDVTFCLRAKAAGFQSYGYTRAQLGHLKGQCLSIDTLAKANA